MNYLELNPRAGGRGGIYFELNPRAGGSGGGEDPFNLSLSSYVLLYICTRMSLKNALLDTIAVHAILVHISRVNLV